MNTNTRLLHTPEGVRDIYNDECRKKNYLETKITAIMDSYGYDPIETPSFEYFDVFSKEIGTVASRDLYKFFDREGDTLVLRPDITPSIARAVSKYYMDDDKIVRFRYSGNTFVNYHSLQGRLKEVTQIGAEYIGEFSPQADAEILAIVVDSLKASGLKEFKISIGHAGILKGLIAEAKLDDNQIDSLRTLLLNKNFFGVEEFAKEAVNHAPLRYLFEMLGVLIQDDNALIDFYNKSIDFPEVHSAIAYLIELSNIIKIYGIEDYITIEPGIINIHDYYTGIIFSGYTYGSGEPIVSGGRYDDLLGHFGKSKPSIGFAIVLDILMSAIERQNISVPVDNNVNVIYYTDETLEDSIIAAKKQRLEGRRVLLTRK